MKAFLYRFPNWTLLYVNSAPGFVCPNKEKHAISCAFATLLRPIGPKNTSKPACWGYIVSCQVCDMGLVWVNCCT